MIELLVAMTILLLLSAAIIARFQTFDNKQVVKQAAATLKTNLRKAQNASVSGKKPASGCSQFLGFAVTFTANDYTIGASCTEGLAGTLDVITLPVGVTFQPIPATVLFRSLSGTVAASTPLVLTGKNTSVTTMVDPSGRVE
jgi:type II secretory pathway pseudopilin PulG